MLDSCRMQFLAERAFFRYNRGGSAVTGETVHLARELARYGVTSTCRASFGLYNTLPEIDKLAVALEKARNLFA